MHIYFISECPHFYMYLEFFRGNESIAQMIYIIMGTHTHTNPPPPRTLIGQINLEKGKSGITECKKNMVQWRKWSLHIIIFNKLEQDSDGN